MQVELLPADCQNSERILELMADGALNTVFKKEFDKIQAKLLEGIKHKKSVAAVAGRVEDVLALGKILQERISSAESINKVTLQDAVANYKTNFVPGTLW
jgi:predicted Zn-dependent peptidase